MSAERAATYDPRSFEPQPQLRVVEALPPQSELQRLITHFDENWRQEGLPQDWYRLRGVGFNVEAEMKVLRDQEIPLSDRAAQSERNLIGFKVEYLDQNASVYPVEYETRFGADGAYLYDKRYKASMISTVSTDERNGSARDALVSVESFMLSAAPVGSLAVMTSPEGPTGAPDGSGGLRDNSGQQIRYPDSYFFVFQKKEGGRVTGFGLRTDSTALECRNVIRRLTGKELPVDAPLEDYVRQIALISPSSEVSSVRDVMDVLRTSRAQDRQTLIDKKNSWEKANADTERGEQLYELDVEGRQIIAEYRDLVSSGSLSDIELQKALSATVLRLSKLYLFDKKREAYSVKGNVIFPDRFDSGRESGPAFGHTLNEVKKIDGCAGGGESANAVKSIIDRQGMAVMFGDVAGLPLDKDMYGKRWFKCGNDDCDVINIRPKDVLLKNCQGCKKPISC